MAEVPDQLQQVDDLGETRWSGSAFRHTAPGRDPLSGEGARQFGGRWNPRDVFATIYLASPVETCIAEFERTARGQGRGASSFLDRTIHEIQVKDLAVVDLTSDGALHAVGLSRAAIGSPDWAPCQRVGELAHYLKLQGVLAPSATGDGVIIAVFESRLRPGQLTALGARALDAYITKSDEPG